MNKYFSMALVLSLIYGCSGNKLEKKGFQVGSPTADLAVSENENTVDGLQKDTMKFESRPRNVLLTAHPEHRLIPIYKVNYHKKTKEPFTGTNTFHYNYMSVGERDGNQWNSNFMPGFEAVYGYNFVNVSHYNNQVDRKTLLFESPVLIKTLYYPAFTRDTLNFKPVLRTNYMVSAYDEDTNNDGYINVQDLRRLYYFDMDAANKRALIPKNYSVMSSEYDPANDYMYVFAKMDENSNGKMENQEQTHVFWIDLSDPTNRGRQY